MARIRLLQAKLEQENLPGEVREKIKKDLKTVPPKMFEMEKHGLPDHMMAIDLSVFQGRSALDVMNEQDEENQLAKAKLPQALEGLGPRMPPELVHKTIQQLKALGAQEVGSYDFNPATRAMTEHSSIDVIDDAESAESTRQFLRSMDDEESDGNFFLDNLQTNDDPFEDTSSRYSNREIQKKKVHHQIMKRQHEIDMVAVRIAAKALQSGIALPGDPVYEEMLEEYPHYQVKRERREKQLKDVSKFIERYEAGSVKDLAQEPAFRYKFEAQLSLETGTQDPDKKKRRSARNLASMRKLPEEQVVEVEAVPEEEDMAALYLKYK